MIKLIHGDSYQILPTLDLSGYSRIAIVTDPPYEIQTGGVDREYFREIHKVGLTSGFDYRIFEMVDAKNIITFCSKPQRPGLEQFLMQRYHRVEELRWQKLNPPPFCNNCYVTDYEPWLHAWQNGHHPVGQADDLRTHISTVVGGKSGIGHPTVKPMQVMVKAMRPLQADLIIDPFMGSGTTGVVARQMGIDFIGIEINESYMAMAQKRLQEPLAQGFIL